MHECLPWDKICADVAAAVADYQLSVFKDYKAFVDLRCLIDWLVDNPHPRKYKYLWSAERSVIRERCYKAVFRMGWKRFAAMNVYCVPESLHVIKKPKARSVPCHVWRNGAQEAAEAAGL